MGRTFNHSKPRGIVVEHSAFGFDRRDQGSVRGLWRYMWKTVVQKGRLRDMEDNIRILPRNGLITLKKPRFLKNAFTSDASKSHFYILVP